MQRLRELSHLGDIPEAEKPAVAELQRLAHAVGDIEPPPDAQARVRAALHNRRSSRPSWQTPVLAVVVLAVAATGAVVSTTRSPSVSRPVQYLADVATVSERRVTSPAVDSTMSAAPAKPEIVGSHPDGVRVADVPVHKTSRSDPTQRAPDGGALVRSDAVSSDGLPYLGLAPDKAGNDALQRAIMHNYGCTSFWVEEVPVEEEFSGQVVWQGTVQVFELLGHPKAKRAYAWSYATGANKWQFHTVLELGPVKDAVTAVRAEIAAETKGGAP